MRFTRRLVAAAVTLGAVAGGSAAHAQTPGFELGAVQCLNGGEMRVFPPPVMRPTDGNGPEAVAWSPNVLVLTADGWRDYNTSAPFYQASTNSIGYGFTPFGRGFYGPLGQLSFVPFRGLTGGRYLVRNFLWWQRLGQTFTADAAGCTFTGPGGATAPPPAVPAPAPTAPPPTPRAPAQTAPRSGPGLFARGAPTRLSWRRLRRGYTILVRSVGPRSQVSARLSIGGRRLAYSQRIAPGTAPVPVTIRVPRARLVRLARGRVRTARLVLTAQTRNDGQRTFKTQRRVRLVRR